jgi:hypothetical protein
MVGWMDGWMDGGMCACMYVWIGEQMDDWDYCNLFI